MRHMLCHASLNIRAALIECQWRVMIDQRSKHPSVDLKVPDPTKFLCLERY